MAKQLQIRGGTTAQHSTFTGAVREITVDTDKDVVVVHDGSTAGGFPLAKQTSVDAKVAKVTSTDNAIVRFDGVTGDVQNSGVIIDDSGNLLLQSGTGALGYGTGAGGTVTQLTNKGTAVTLNKPTGTIITANTALAAGAVVQFIVACSSVTSIYDTVYATQESAAVIDTSRYEIRCAGMYGGSFVVSIKNVSGTSYSEAIPIKFIVFKGAIS